MAVDNPHAAPRRALPAAECTCRLQRDIRAASIRPLGSAWTHQPRGQRRRASPKAEPALRQWCWVLPVHDLEVDLRADLRVEADGDAVGADRLDRVGHLDAPLVQLRAAGDTGRLFGAVTPSD